MHVKQKMRIISAMLALGLLATILYRLGGLSEKPETLTIAVPPLEQNALLYVAAEKGLFSANGLAVVIRDYDSGPKAIEAMVKGEADIAETAEYPVVSELFRNGRIRIIACNDKFENDYLAVRKDRGIRSVRDLGGRRIGLSRRTINEFYLGRLLELNAMRTSDVTLVDIRPDQYVSAMAGGDVDAVIAWQPHIARIMKQVDVWVWPAQSNQSVFGVLTCDDGWLAGHSGQVERLLKSLAAAEDFINRHPDQAKAIVRKRLKYDDAYISEVWPKHRFSLSLDFSLFAAMNDEARWAIKNGLAPENRMPEIMNCIYPESLRKIKPEAVNIVR